MFSLAGGSLNGTVLQALPFVALGLGVDDMFLILQVFRETPKRGLGPAEVVGEVLARGGASVTLTSLCNACAFFAGSLIPLPAGQHFCVAAGPCKKKKTAEHLEY